MTAPDPVELPDPLPEPIAAALALPVDLSTFAGARAAVQRIAWAVWAMTFVNPRTYGPSGANLGPAHVAAAARQHPELGAYVADMTSQGLAMMCTEAFERRPAYTDLGLAERLAVLRGPDLAWTPALGGWQTWDGRRWSRDASETAGLAAMKATVRTLVQAEHVAAIGDEPDAVAARKFAHAAQGMKAMKPAVELAKSEPGITVTADAWDAEPALLSVENGTLELTDGGAKLRDHARADRLTRVARASYRPRAAGPLWDRFTRDVLPDPEVRDYMQRLAGCALLNGNPHRLLVVLLGPTSTGKSTMLEALVHALGDHAGAFDLGLFRASKDGGAPRADLVDALPRRLIVTSEASDRWELHADAIKRLTGNDTQKARTLYARTSVERRPAFTPIIATNSAPRIVGADTALWRRLVVIPFETTVTREDEHLGERLRTEESAAVLRWMVDGFDAYAARGLGTPPAACRAAAMRLRADLSLIDQWLADCTEPDADAAEEAATLGDSWHNWCLTNRVPERERINNVALGKALTARGIGRRYAGRRDGRRIIRTGLRLIEPELSAGVLRAVT